MLEPCKHLRKVTSSSSPFLPSFLIFNTFDIFTIIKFSKHREPLFHCLIAANLSITDALLLLIFTWFSMFWSTLPAKTEPSSSANVYYSSKVANKHVTGKTSNLIISFSFSFFSLVYTNCSVRKRKHQYLMSTDWSSTHQMLWWWVFNKDASRQHEKTAEQQWWPTETAVSLIMFYRVVVIFSLSRSTRERRRWQWRQWRCIVNISRATVSKKEKTHRSYRQPWQTTNHQQQQRQWSALTFISGKTKACNKMVIIRNHTYNLLLLAAQYGSAEFA